MIYKRFIIENYKAIKCVKIDVSKSIIPLIGINESGKTSILQGILAFDKTKDNLLDGTHIDVKNRYNTKQRDCVLKAEIIFKNKEEFEEIGKKINLRMDQPLYGWLKNIVDSGSYITLQRNFKDGILLSSYSLVNVEKEILELPKISNLINEFVKRLPSILYFDDFSDRVPSNVIFPNDYLENQKLASGKQREWQEIIVEIFSRALDEKFSLAIFMNLKDEDDKNNYLEDVKAILNKEIITEWKNLKSNYENLGDDSINLEIQLGYLDSEKKFTFKIKDSECGNGRYFDIQQRSKGFQWFFNFIMKLKFNPKYKENPEDAIYLLDEPGSYLHSSAQTELLKKLCNIGKKNTIIYCTHSQYLLDPDVINIGSIKIVSKEEGTITITDYGDSKCVKNLGAFSPLYHALNIKYGFGLSNIKYCILTEGITDYYFFNLFLKFQETNVIPGSGCSQLKEMISLLISFSEKFLIILDNDQAGRNSQKLYSKFFNDSFNNSCYIYDFNKNGDFVLEDLLSEKDCLNIMSVTKCDDIKNAITKLYFLNNEIKDNIINNFDVQTLKNINILENKINSYFNI
jgi:predicted ATP-dependent endonuclease of OLD family